MESQNTKNLKMGKIILVIFCLSCFCSRSEKSNLGVASWQGRDLTGNLVLLKNIESETLILNVYSPNCVPCKEEIPFLMQFYKQIKKNPTITFFMIIDPTSIIENAKKLSKEELFKKSSEIMKEEQKNWQETLPLLIMDESFQISNQSVVNGYPETLIFKTKPLNLIYNFIGPISTTEDWENILKEPRVQFFNKMVGI